MASVNMNVVTNIYAHIGMAKKIHGTHCLTKGRSDQLKIKLAVCLPTPAFSLRCCLLGLSLLLQSQLLLTRQ